jgi:hypothetical protein
LYISDLDQPEILEDWSFFQITLGLLYTILQKNLEFDQTITDDFMANIMKMLKFASMNRDREDLLTCVAMLSMTELGTISITKDQKIFPLVLKCVDKDYHSKFQTISSIIIITHCLSHAKPDPTLWPCLVKAGLFPKFNEVLKSNDGFVLTEALNC